MGSEMCIIESIAAASPVEPTGTISRQPFWTAVQIEVDARNTSTTTAIRPRIFASVTGAGLKYNFTIILLLVTSVLVKSALDHFCLNSFAAHIDIDGFADLAEFACYVTQRNSLLE